MAYTAMVHCCIFPHRSDPADPHHRRGIDDMERLFDEKKATQAAACFLKLADGGLNYMVLIKDLYLSDRQALARWGRSITNDKYYSMKCGPVLSNVLDLIHEQPMPEDTTFWSKFISPPSNYQVSLVDDPGADLLSVVEEELLKSTFKEEEPFQTKPFEFVKHLHSSLPEWERRDYGRSEITIRSILLAVKKTADEINEIEDCLSNINLVHSRFGAGD